MRVARAGTMVGMLELDARIFRAGAGDASALARLSAALFPLGCPANTPPEDLADYIRRELTPERFRLLLEDERNLLLMANVSGDLAGYALIMPAPSPAHIPSVPYELRKFYMDPAWHGRGVAHALMEELLAQAAERGYDPLWLSVFSENQRAMSFYARWGFEIAGTQEFLVGSDRQKDFLMVREAASRAAGSARQAGKMKS